MSYTYIFVELYYFLEYNPCMLCKNNHVNAQMWKKIVFYQKQAKQKSAYKLETPALSSSKLNMQGILCKHRFVKKDSHDAWWV